GGGVRHPLPARAVRRTAPARGRRPGAGRRSAADASGRAVRGARPDHAPGAPGRVPRHAAPASQDGDLRHARPARGGAGRRSVGAPRRGAPAGRGNPRGARRLDGCRRRGVPRGGARLVSAEILSETGRHLLLVAVSVGLATLVGVPLGILLTRRPGWQRLVLGAANVVQTIPSLALFGLLIPVPFIGGRRLRPAPGAADALPRV